MYQKTIRTAHPGYRCIKKMKATVKQIFEKIRLINPSTNSVSSVGNYVSSAEQLASDSFRQEIKSFLPANSLAYAIINKDCNLSEKQLWVIAFELLKNEDFVNKISAEIDREDIIYNQKIEASKAKLNANKSASQEFLNLVKSNGLKLADYYSWLKKSVYKKEFYSKKFSDKSVNEFINLNK